MKLVPDNMHGFGERPHYDPRELDRIFEKILTDDPENVVALTWSAWQLSLSADNFDPVDARTAKALAAEGIPVETVELARQYWAAYRDLCAPLDETSLARALLGLRDMTIRKAEEGSDWQVTLENWLDELRHYPADIVLWAIGFWRRNERFWPTWMEFKQLLDRRVAQRVACMDALQRIGERGRALAIVGAAE